MIRKSSAISINVEELQNRFGQWRQNRQGRAPIPDELWAAAAEAASSNGVNRTAAALHLDGGKLKRRMVAADVSTRKKMPEAFVELIAPPSTGLPECVIELEGRQGRIRIHWKGVRAADLAELSRALLA
jgi:hypothetical protein